MLCVLCISTFLFCTEAKAATSGDIPCSQGAVSWTLDEQGVLTFSGDGKTNLENSTDKNWWNYWANVELQKSDVLSVKVAQNSNIRLDTCNQMFYGFAKCVSIDMRGFATDCVLNMQAMFCNCYALKDLNVSELDTSKVEFMDDMFMGCVSLTQLDLSKFKTGEVTNMYRMFANCNSLTKLDLSNFDTRKVTQIHAMFMGCKSLIQLDFGNFDTSHAWSTSSMFENCKSLNRLDISGFDTSNVTSMEAMFKNCKALTQLDLRNFDTSKVQKMQSMFEGCSSLTQLNISSFDMETTSNIDNMLQKCNALEVIVTPKTTFTIKLPTVTTEKYWLDTEKNFYSGGEEYTFSKSTELHCVKETYKINYVGEGELVNCPTTYKVIEGCKELGTLNHPYATFLCWYWDDTYTMPALAIERGTFGDITLYGKIERSACKITYRNIDHVLNKEKLPIEYICGIEKTIPRAEKHCYAFLGWFLDEAYTKPIYMITKETSGDLTLYAKWTVAHDVDREKGQVIKSATEDETGMMQYPCKHCTYRLTEVIPKLEIKPDPTEQVIIKSGEKDPKGSSFSKIQARVDKTTKNSIRIKWNQVTGATGYIVYGNTCGKKNSYEPIQIIKNKKETSFTHKKCKKGTYYKYIVYAFRQVDGKREMVAVSKTIHATTKGKQYGNAQSVKVNKTKVYLKKKETFYLKGVEVAQKGKKIKKHRALCYESSNVKVATVSKKGVIKAKKKGTCYVYAYAQNGVYKKIKVNVK